MRTLASWAALWCGLAVGGCGSSSSAPAQAQAEQPTASEPAQPAPPAGRRAEAVTFDSAALGVTKRVNVLLPAGYDKAPDIRYPVVYMLHGLGGDEDNWLELGIAKAADEVGLEAIIVMPDGDDSFYVNWHTQPDYDKCMAGRRPFGKANDMSTYCVKSARYADYLMTDLVGFIDGKYRTIASKKGRAIGGLSMGGYGALVTAFRNTDKFAAVASHAGVASLRYIGPLPYQTGKAVLLDNPDVVIKGSMFGPHFGRIYGTDIADWIARDPVALVDGLADAKLAIYLDAGTKDGFRLQNGGGHLSDVLKDKGVEHEWHLIEGGKHDSAFWTSRVDDSLRFFNKHLR